MTAFKEGKRILVCDDERHIARLLEVNFTRQGHVVACAYGGREAIGWLQRETFDMAVIDRHMPDMSGDEVLAWIRSNERTREMRVIVIDKENDDDPPAGADLYLTKPFNPLDLFR